MIAEDRLFKVLEFIKANGGGSDGGERVDALEQRAVCVRGCGTVCSGGEI